MRTPQLQHVLLAVFGLFLSDGRAFADPIKCQQALLKESGKFAQARLKALGSCEDTKLTGKLPPGTDCATDAKTAEKLSAAGAKLEAAIAKACGGKDKTCGTVDDESLSLLLWPPKCPDFEGKGCTNAISDCGDVTECLRCMNTAAVEQAVALYYGDLLPSRPRAPLNKCARTIGSATRKFYAAKAKALEQCFEARMKRKHSNVCPDPGDGKAVAAIAKAESLKRTKICAVCGGKDKGCDGNDDLTPIALPAQCPPVSTCGSEMTSLADVVDCVDCVTAFKVDCAVPLAIPGLATYPEDCIAVLPTPTPASTSSPASTQTPTPVPTATGQTLCGDNLVNDASEECDGIVDGACPGACQPTCTCGSFCGDGTINQASEACDGTAVGGETCASQGFAAGTLRCATDCSAMDLTLCAEPSCGDGRLVASEPCDGTELRGATCESLGFGSGSLTCLANCAGLNTDACAAPSSIPLDPVTTAPPLDRSRVTDACERGRFLFLNENRVQFGVGAEVIQCERAAIIHGRVLDRSGNGIAGAFIRVRHHPEYGLGVTRTDGAFELVVNGGTILNLDYTKNGHLPVQRQVEIAPQQDAELPDVVLVEKDSNVTTIDLTAATPMQVAQGSMVTDAAGTRQGVVMVPQGTGARRVLPDGSSESISTLSLRITEYTVGENGPAAMPAELPAMSGYTYAVEIGADEAVAKVAGRDVLLDQPVSYYVENFLGMPIGSDVPVGYYDADAAAWIPSDNGRVIGIVGITAGLADVDTDGDGVADGPPTLAALELTDAERQQLAGLYSVGQTLWRSRLTHLSTHDLNWPVVCPDGETCPDPELATPNPNPPLSCPGKARSSIIECENQVLREELAITGTPFTLHYASDRVPGLTSRLDIQLSGATVPPNLRAIGLGAYIDGGQTIALFFPPTPNQSYQFVWNGLDRYGRAVQGEVGAYLSVTYYYDGVYAIPASSRRAFGAPAGDGSFPPIPSRNGVRRSQSFILSLPGAGWDARPIGLGGWSLSAHHVYDPLGRILYPGSGGRRSAADADPVVRSYAGGAAGGDGSFRLQASLGTGPSGIAEGPDGTLYVSDYYLGKVRRIGHDGIVRTIAGTGTTGYSGDGGSALEAEFQNIADIAVGPDGSVYVLQWGEPDVLRRIGPDGNVQTFAGGGTNNEDGIPATLARIDDTWGIAVGRDGNVYIADTSGHRVRQVSRDGTIRTVAGNGANTFSGDGGPARQAALSFPLDVAIAPDGSLYIADSGNKRIRHVDPQGIITTVAGNGGFAPFLGDGGPATAASLSSTTSSVAVDLEGTFYIADDGNRRIRRVTRDGKINTLIGRGEIREPIEGYAAGYSPIRSSSRILASRDGSLYFNSGFPIDFGSRLWRIGHALPGLSMTDIAIPSQGASELYVFDARGRHLRTLHALTGQTLFEFSYDGAGRLIGVRDGDDNTTTVERDATGNPTAIVSPYGQRTTLTLDANGFLASVTNPATERYGFSYDSRGLLQTMTTPRNHTTTYKYDATGRLELAEDPAGGSHALTRMEFLGLIGQSGHEILRTTALGRQTRYRVETGPSSPLIRSNLRYLKTVTEPDGTVDQTWLKHSGEVEHRSASDVVTNQREAPDPRFGMQSPFTGTLQIQLPSGLTYLSGATREVTLKDSGNPLSVDSVTDVHAVNARLWYRSYDQITRRFTSTSPEGRKNEVTIDGQGRVVRAEIPGLFPAEFSYDARGRLTQVAQGTEGERRVTSFRYGPSGLLDLVTDPLLNTVGFDYDLSGRVTLQLLPGARQVGIGYNANGSLASVTPPGRPAHAFEYTKVDLQRLYTPPDVGLPNEATQYDYNADRQPALVTRPDGQTSTYAYDVAGRLGTITAPHGVITYGYDAAGRVQTITAPGPETLTYAYDGNLPTTTTWSGTVNGSVARTYDDDFRLKTITVNGENPITYTYDADGLVIQAGELTIGRDQRNGLVATTTLGNITDTYEYNGFGEMIRYTARFKGAVIYELELGRDQLGQITMKKESAEGVARVYEYAYDDAGRLFHVFIDGVQTAEYLYDSNGNRVTAPGLSSTPMYDDQDRLLKYNGAAYAYTANGELRTITDDTGTTTYDYDVFGMLHGVDLPGPSDVLYIADGENRRIARLESGNLVQGLLYQDGLRPIAELDQTGTPVSRFVYASTSTVPAYMVKGGATYRIITDHLASPRIIVDAENGQIVQRMRHDAFGIVMLDTFPQFQPFGFAGGLTSPLTAHLRLGVRDYDPLVGRWMTSDPLRFGASGTNVYTYALNNPVRFQDSNGKDIWVEGASGCEPVLHQSINVGDPSGVYYSQSFAVNGGGLIYQDSDKGGQIERYMKTTPLEDQVARTFLEDEQKGDQNRLYGLDGTCRGYSQDRFDMFKEAFLGNEGIPRPRHMSSGPSTLKCIATRMGTATTVTGASTDAK